MDVTVDRKSIWKEIKSLQQECQSLMISNGHRRK
ncbi:hypothetical protein M7I_1913 [Glarea lozoyensis 74030]|uniref:Uncharacterized protein n=1 Tax=Glarea lozoyensis (strain ATCC 74030 / MF5533) TaxID=1104152 RepID=H0EHD5_GLAL7|nr:hypothetical protein M7I_1913 [Glarea lozoyensis 74030]